ncbi:MAG TPA: DUF3883 domain-containing protein [Brevundimonas sp.]
MADQSKRGTDWNADELDAIVADYFAMLAMDAANQPFVKAHRAQALDAGIGRGHKSIEFKHMNISAVAAELGLPFVRGYRPMSNYQAAIFPAIDRYLSAHPEAWRIGDAQLLAPSPSMAGGGVSDTSRAFASPFTASAGPTPTDAVPTLSQAARPALRLLIFEPPPEPGAARARPEGLRRLIRKFDPAAQDASNRALGKAGEEHIYFSERDRLIAAERPDLASKVQWTSQELGDGAGYDIRSYDPSGAERFIEVKTTRGGARTDFFLSRNERAFSDEEPERYRLYRLYEFAAEPRLFALQPPLDQAVRLETETWRAGF